MSETIRVVLVDDQELIRVGFRLVLEAEDDISVVGESADGLDAIDVVLTARPDVVLMDVRMPRLNGIEATARIVELVPDARILVLTTFDLDEYAFGALSAGASGFLLKDAQRSELIAAVRALHRGDAVVSPRVTREMLTQWVRPRAQSSAQAHVEDPTKALTERERDVFLSMARGLSNAEIATELFLSESTVKTHIGRILAKLQARDRVHAVILAYQAGLLGEGMRPS